VVSLFLINNNHIYRAAEVITAFVDKQGALVVIFEGETSRKLFHDDDDDDDYSIIVVVVVIIIVAVWCWWWWW